MAEPRRPRVIKTRPGAARPASAAPGAADAAAAGTPVPAGTVRPISSKVSVMPLDAMEPPPADSTEAGPRRPAPGRKSKGTGTPDATGTPDDSATPGASGAPDVPGTTRRWPGLPQRRAKSASGQNAGKDPRDAGAAAGGATVLAFPEPGYKRRRRLLLWTAASVVAVLAAIMTVALYSPVLAVKDVVFEGNSLVATETLEATLAPVMGKPLPQVTDGEVGGLLEPIVQVKSARIQARPPSTLVVQLVERVPVALLKNGEEYVLVDQDGVQLGATADQAAASLPLIDGGKAVIGEDTFQAMTAVLANLPQSILKQLANASANSPDAVELKLTDGRRIIWGSPSDMELKAQVLQALLNAPPAAPEANKPAPAPAKVFDVSAPRHPVTRSS